MVRIGITISWVACRTAKFLESSLGRALKKGEPESRTSCCSLIKSIPSMALQLERPLMTYMGLSTVRPSSLRVNLKQPTICKSDPEADDRRNPGGIGADERFQWFGRDLNISSLTTDTAAPVSIKKFTSFPLMLPAAKGLLSTGRSLAPETQNMEHTYMIMDTNGFVLISLRRRGECGFLLALPSFLRLTLKSPDWLPQHQTKGP